MCIVICMIISSDDLYMPPVRKLPADNSRLCYSFNGINNLLDWVKWMMSFNPGKCEVLQVTAKQKNIIKAVYTIHGKPLNTVIS